MKTFKIVVTVMVAALAASCNPGFDDVRPELPPETNGNGEYVLSVSAGQKGGAGSGAVNSRAFMDMTNGIYYWDGDDRIGLTAIDAASPQVVLNNFQMRRTDTGRARETTFYGELTKAQAGAMDPNGTYNYYSYFPYTASAGATSFTFTLGNSITLTPDVFNTAYAPMVGVPQTNKEAIVFQKGQENVLTHDDLLVHFDYKHVMSYAAFEMDVYLGGTVTSIDISSSASLSGTMTIDLTSPDGPHSWAPSGNTLHVNFTGGILSTGSVLYIPMAPGDYTGHTFTVTFNGTSNVVLRNSRTFNGVVMERGKIHSLKVAPEAAEYRTDVSFTVTKSGYYYVEAWGGDGGTGGNSSGNNTTIGVGGTAQRQAELLYFASGANMKVQVGTAGGNGMNYSGRSGGPGGSAGSGLWFGAGAAGGYGGQGGALVSNGGGGGGGGSGAASGVLINNDIVIASGGGGGGGGASGNGETAGNGGNSGEFGKDGGTIRDGRGGNGWQTDNTQGQSGTVGGVGSNFLRGGGGGGAGGGGWNGGTGGGGFYGNGGTPYLSIGRTGGGGAGGASAVRASAVATTTPTGYVQPNNPRAGTNNINGNANGYVVITFFRE